MYSRATVLKSKQSDAAKKKAKQQNQELEKGAEGQTSVARTSLAPTAVHCYSSTLLTHRDDAAVKLRHMLEGGQAQNQQ